MAKVDIDNMSREDRVKYFRSWKYATKDEVQDFGLMGKYKDARAIDHLGRSGSFLYGSGALNAGKENFANAFGFLTSHQKASFLNRMLIPLGSGYLGINASMDGKPEDFFATGAGMAAGLQVARPVAELGHGVGKALKMGGASRILGWGAGGLAGLAVGAAAYMGTSAMLQSFKNNNFVQKAVMPLNKDLMTTRGLETNNTLTARQRALSKLSRAGLNDRGQLLGNEAMVIRGML